LRALPEIPGKVGVQSQTKNGRRIPPVFCATDLLYLFNLLKGVVEFPDRFLCNAGKEMRVLV
jgi:hypothetical protein